MTADKFRHLENSDINPQTIEDFKLHVPGIKEKKHRDAAIKLFQWYANNPKIEVSKAANWMLEYFNSVFWDLIDLDSREWTNTRNLILDNSKDFRDYRAA